MKLFGEYGALRIQTEGEWEPYTLWSSWDYVKKAHKNKPTFWDLSVLGIKNHWGFGLNAEWEPKDGYPDPVIFALNLIVGPYDLTLTKYRSDRLGL